MKYEELKDECIVGIRTGNLKTAQVLAILALAEAVRTSNQKVIE